jgi:hypothetical protein
MPAPLLNFIDYEAVGTVKSRQQEICNQWLMAFFLGNRERLAGGPGGRQ